MKCYRIAIVKQKYKVDGGSERSTVSIINNIINNNNNVIRLSLITRQWLGELSVNYNTYICNPFIWNRLSRELGFARAAKKCWQQHGFDIIQSHERIVGCDIFRAGDGIHKVWLEQYSRILSKYERFMKKHDPYHKYILNVERRLFESKRLKKIICNSKMVYQDILNCYNIEKNKIVIIKNFVNLKYFVPANHQQRCISKKFLSIPAKSCTLIYVGSGFLRKGLKQIIIALSNTDRYLIVIGYDKCVSIYYNLAQTLGCLSRIRFIGICRNLLPYYHAADALILPSLYDPFPNVILEAMSCGLPVITSKTCGGAELIQEGKEGFICDALDIASLKEFICSIPLIDKDSLMSISSRNKIKGYSASFVSNQFGKLYEDILMSNVFLIYIAYINQYIY